MNDDNQITMLKRRIKTITLWWMINIIVFLFIIAVMYYAQT